MSTAIHHHVLRSVSLSIHPCICPSTSSSSFPSIYLATHAFIWSTTLLAIFRSSDLCIYHLSVYLSIFLSIYLSMYLSIYRSIDLSIYLSIIFLDSLMHQTSLRDFSWQHQGRTTSAKLPPKVERSVLHSHPRANSFCDFSAPPI